MGAVDGHASSADAAQSGGEANRRQALSGWFRFRKEAFSKGDEQAVIESLFRMSFQIEAHPKRWKQEMLLIKVELRVGDPTGNRTRATTVKGWCPNR